MQALLWLIQSLTVILGAAGPNGSASPEGGGTWDPNGNPLPQSGGTWDPNG